MAFNDNFTNGGGSQNLGARSGWTYVDGVAGDCYVGASGTALNNNPSGESSWICTSQATADHYTEAVCMAGGGFVTIRHTDVNNFIGFRHNGSAWQVYKRVAGAFTQLGSDYVVALTSGDVGRLTASGNTITFTVNSVARCLGAGVSETFNNTVQRQGVVSRGTGGVPWINDFTADAYAASSSPLPPSKLINQAVNSASSY